MVSPRLQQGAEALRARGIPFWTLDGYTIKIGAINFYPTTGKITSIPRHGNTPSEASPPSFISSKPGASISSENQVPFRRTTPGSPQGSVGTEGEKLVFNVENKVLHPTMRGFEHAANGVGLGFVRKKR